MVRILQVLRVHGPAQRRMINGKHETVRESGRRCLLTGRPEHGRSPRLQALREVVRVAAAYPIGGPHVMHPSLRAAQCERGR